MAFLKVNKSFLFFSSFLFSFLGYKVKKKKKNSFPDRQVRRKIKAQHLLLKEIFIRATETIIREIHMTFLC